MSVIWPGPTAPMLATAADGPFDSPQYWFEIKWDGIRCLCYVERGGVRLQSRQLRDLTDKYPGLAGLAGRFCGRQRAVLDCELIGFVGRRPSFRGALRTGGAKVAVAFDLLHLDGEDLIELPLERRHDMLAGAFVFEGELVRSSPVPAQGVRYYTAVVEKGLEGVVAKRLGSPYRPGLRSSDWRKIVARRTLDCVVGGVTAGAQPAPWRGRTIGFGSLAVGRWRDDRLVYLGNVGSGFNRRELPALLAAVSPRDVMPFDRMGGPPARIVKATTWVAPELVIEVAYRELGPAGILRHASFRRVRPGATAAGDDRASGPTEGPGGRW